MARKGEATRERIIREAMGLFQQKGFGATTLGDILEATGLKKGALYFHFAGKEEIALQVLERARGELLAFIDSTLAGTSPPESLANHFAGLTQWQRRLSFAGGCIFGNAALEMADSKETFASFVRSVFDEWRERLAAVIAAGQEEGTLRRDLPPGELAQHLLAVIEGGIMLARLYKSDTTLRHCFAPLDLLLRPST